ncbi:hypothetical protein V6N12_064680 [Hibiscus sabdariffa]|uniref:RNase H type-1 domain-containing protein n=1 Tax=Hibiscus sabdariffa TaxID=183260 RepID=A0ABR2G6N7_9ROSI
MTENWCAHLVGSFKFNVDGVLYGSFGPDGIGGIFRDHPGKIILKFSKSVGYTNSSSAKLLAIKEAFESFVESTHVAVVNLVVESDCSNVVSSIGNPISCPMVFKDLVVNCLKASRGFNWKINLVRREFNCVTDVLAKTEIK